MEKTKDTMVTFSGKQRELVSETFSTIHGQTVEVVEKQKYVDTIFDCTLRFASNTEDQ